MVFAYRQLSRGSTQTPNSTIRWDQISWKYTCKYLVQGGGVPLHSGRGFNPNTKKGRSAARRKTNPQVLEWALVVNPTDTERTTLQRILTGEGWKSAAVPTIANARSWMTCYGCPPVIICERDLPDGNWLLLFQETEAMPQSPKFVVSSRLADDHLWSEVLNLGADSVLAVPFDAQEVTYVVRSAMDARKDRWGAKSVRKSLAAAASAAV